MAWTRFLSHRRWARLDIPEWVTYDAKGRGKHLFGGGFAEFGFILFLAYLLLGPEKLPEIARVLGKGLGELRRASFDLRNSLEEEIRNMDQRKEIPAETTPSAYGHDYTEPTHEESDTQP